VTLTAAALLLVVGGLLAIMHFGLGVRLRPDNRSATVPDPQLVYCLAPQRASALGQAVVALGLAEATVPPDRIVAVRSAGRSEPPVTEMTIAEWRRAHPDDFRRACDALVKAAPIGQGTEPVSPKSDPFRSWLDVAYSSLLPLLTGALVAKLSLNRQRRGDLADQLRAAQPEFSEAVTACLDRPGDGGTGAVMNQRRQALGALLTRAAALRPGRPLAPALKQLRENQGPLGVDFFGVSISGSAAEADHRRAVDAALQEVQELVQSLTRELDTPRWRSWGWA
jgi:hypothetical protein